MKIISAAVPPTKNSPTTELSEVLPRYSVDFKKCELSLNIGIFFDGTKNNRDSDSKKYSHSNIARLYEAYNSDELAGYRKFYVPGVGTEFTDIGEFEESLPGAGCAFGCEARVIFGLLAVFNAIHSRCFRTNMYNKGTILALCRNSQNVGDAEDRKNLAKFPSCRGLLQKKIGNSSYRIEFLTQQALSLTWKLKNKKPRVVECFVDVFGFSRGAAEARVFCHWLNELLINDCLAGVPLRFRFVGIFDTVASAGFWSGGSAMVSNSTGGHGAWASAESLSLPTSVRNCVHMVAMHEFRRNFPLDEIGTNGKLQQGWIQYAYPGSHSDVGGGYRPGELGIAVGDDSMKLSQIPLNHMLDCAITAGAPMKKAQAISATYDPFAIHPALARAYDDFISEAALKPRPMYEWLQPYLNWRWQVRDQFHAMKQVKQATQSDREILIAFNKSLISDAASMTRSSTMNLGKRTFAVVTDILSIGARKDLYTTMALEPEAREVFALAQCAKATPVSFATLFDGYVHDSLAGFNSPKLELTGYWRYRRVFLGNDDYTIAAHEDTDAARSTA